MHLQRWLTSLIALPLLLYIILWGPPLIFLLLLVLISSAAHWEYLTICGLGQTPTARALGLGLGLIVLLGFFSDQPYLPGFCLTAGMLVYFLFFLLKFEEFPHLLPELALSCLGLCYVPFLVGHFYWLWQAPPDRLWLLWLLAVIFAGDTGAFYFGRWFGVRKLYPLVSPGKTVAGALGGLAASLTIGLGLGLWLPLGVALPML
ncbi:MAG TPA: hypothetical protein DCY27_13930, partial [Desulfobacterales bacterium]|nr:hypothetical protein [Desulfobacterales bacterium]